MSLPLRSLLAGAAVLLRLGHMDTARAESATSFAVGTCIIVNQNITLQEGATFLAENNGCAAGSPEKSYILRFFWVDSRNMSLIFSGYTDSALKALFGPAPKFFNNDVYRTMSELVRSFGFKPHSESTFFGTRFTNTIQGKNRTAATETRAIGDLSASELSQMHMYAGEQLIIWPDVASSNAAKQSTTWPSTYSLTYSPSTYRNAYPIKSSDIRFDKNVAEANAAVFNCTLLYKFVGAAEMDQYEDRLAEAERVILANALDEGFFVNAEQLSFQHAILDNPGVAAIRYFTGKNWPRDFVVALGNFRVGVGCGESHNFGFYLLPRRVFVLLAVIEPRGGAINIDGASFITDDDVTLRAERALGRAEETRFSPITIKRGESLVIPLHIELRYDTNVFPFTAIKRNALSTQLHRAVSSAPVKQFNSTFAYETSDAKTKLRIGKDKSAFRPPDFDTVAEKYFFGKSRDLVAIFIDGKKVETRPTPRVAVVMNGKFEEGSCPFLYFRTAEGQLAMIGRVLVGANGPAREREERIRIEPGTRAFVLSEAEPEVTFIRSLNLRNEETGELLNIGTNFYIGANRAFEFQIPDRFQASGQIVIKGYYKTFDAVVTGMAD
jgi:hypothetical protein